LADSAKADHLWEELISLKSHILRAPGINETLAPVGGKRLAIIVSCKLPRNLQKLSFRRFGAREGKEVSRAADWLPISPKKVRRILRNAGLIEQGE
jgi:hypothetical protein